MGFFSAISDDYSEAKLNLSYKQGVLKRCKNGTHGAHFIKKYKVQMMLPKLLKIRTYHVPPKSTNSLYWPTGKNRLQKSYGYRLFRKIMEKLINRHDGFLPDDMTGFGLYVEVGICKEFDLDNTLKGVIDALQEAYGFNDNQINGIIASKFVIDDYPLTLAKRREQYVKIGLLELSGKNHNFFTQGDLSNAQVYEDVAPNPATQALLFGSVSTDQIELGKDPVYPQKFDIAPDLENAARQYEIDGGPDTILKMMRETTKDTKFMDNVAAKLGIDKKEVKNFKVAITNRIQSGPALDKLISELEEAEPWILGD